MQDIQNFHNSYQNALMIQHWFFKQLTRIIQRRSVELKAKLEIKIGLDIFKTKKRISSHSQSFYLGSQTQSHSGMGVIKINQQQVPQNNVDSRLSIISSQIQIFDDVLADQNLSSFRNPEAQFIPKTIKQELKSPITPKQLYKNVESRLYTPTKSSLGKYGSRYGQDNKSINMIMSISPIGNKSVVNTTANNKTQSIDLKESTLQKKINQPNPILKPAVLQQKHEPIKINSTKVITPKPDRSNERTNKISMSKKISSQKIPFIDRKIVEAPSNLKLKNITPVTKTYQQKLQNTYQNKASTRSNNKPVKPIQQIQEIKNKYFRPSIQHSRQVSTSNNDQSQTKSPNRYKYEHVLKTIERPRSELIVKRRAAPLIEIQKLADQSSDDIQDTLNNNKKDRICTQFANESLSYSLNQNDFINIQIDSNSPGDKKIEQALIDESQEQKQQMFKTSNLQVFKQIVDVQNKNRAIYTSGSKIKKSMYKHQRQHQLYQTKNDPNDSSVNVYNTNQIPFKSRNPKYMKANSLSQNLIERGINQKIQPKKLQETIIIQKVQQQINPVKIINRSTSMTKQQRNYFNSDMKHANIVLSQDSSMNQNMRMMDAAQGLNSLNKRQDKHLELDISDITLLNAQQLQKENSDCSVINQGNSYLLSPHSVQENNIYQLRSKGLVFIPDYSNQVNGANQNMLQNNNTKLNFDNSDLQIDGNNNSKSFLDQSDQDIPKHKMNKLIHDNSYALQQLQTFKISQSNTQQINHNIVKMRRKSQSDDVDLANILYVKPLATEHNTLKNSLILPRQNRTVIVHQRSNQQSVEHFYKDLQKVNPEILKIRVEHRAQRNQITDELNLPAPTNDHIRSSQTNLMSIINPNFLPIPQVSKTQIQGSIANTPPDWGAVYQHNPSNLGKAIKKVSQKKYQQSSTLRESNKSQRLVSNRIKQDQINRTQKNKYIISEIKLSEKEKSGLDKIDTKTLKLDAKPSQTSNQYQDFSENMQVDNAYSDVTPRKSIEFNHQRLSQIKSNAINSNDQKQLIFSIQKSSLGEMEELLSQRQIRNTCVGTDELENLMNEDQSSSQLQSVDTLQFGRKNQDQKQSSINKGGENIQANQKVLQSSDKQAHNKELSKTFFGYGQDSINNRSLYGSPSKSNQATFRAQHSNNSRVIVKNVLGVNKVLYIQANGRSLDADVIKELKQEKLKIYGDGIQPLNNIISMHSTIHMEPKFPKEFKDRSVKQGSSFHNQRSLNINKDLPKEDIQSIPQNSTYNNHQNTNLKDAIRSYNPYDQELNFTGKINLNNQKQASVILEQKQQPPLNIQTPKTELIRYSQNRNHCQANDLTKNIVPTVLITSSNYRNDSITYQQPKFHHDDSFVVYHNIQVSNQQLKTAPIVRTKTSQGQRLLLNTQNTKIMRTYQDESADVQTLRAQSNDQEDCQKNDYYKNSNIKQGDRDNQKDFKSSPRELYQTKKGLFYQISQQFSEALNKSSISGKEKNIRQKRQTQIKSQDHETLQQIFESRNLLNSIETHQMTQKNIQLRQNLPLMNKHQHEDSRNHNSSQGKQYQIQKQMNRTNGFMPSANQSLFQAVEKKIFRRERILNNADKSLIDMKGYPFIIPNTTENLNSINYDNKQELSLTKVSQINTAAQSRQLQLRNQFFTKRKDSQKSDSNANNFSLIRKNATVKQILKKSRRNLSTVINHKTDGIRII